MSNYMYLLSSKFIFANFKVYHSLCALVLKEVFFYLDAQKNGIFITSSEDVINIGIKHGFSWINIRQVPREVLKTEPEAAVFNTSLGTWRMLIH